MGARWLSTTPPAPCCSSGTVRQRRSLVPANPWPRFSAPTLCGAAQRQAYRVDSGLPVAELRGAHFPRPAAVKEIRRQPSPRGISDRNLLGGEADREALGRSHGGLSTKIHLTADRRCRPITRILSPDQHGDCPQFIPLIEAIWIGRRGKGWPRIWLGAAMAGKAYSSAANRTYLRKRGIKAVIPVKADQKPTAAVAAVWAGARLRRRIPPHQRHSRPGQGELQLGHLASQRQS